MILQTQSISPKLIPNFIKTQKPKPQKAPIFKHYNKNPVPKSGIKCSNAGITEPKINVKSKIKAYPEEVSRTIMEICKSGTLSTLTHDGWPLGIGVRFAVDLDGTPVLCLDGTATHFSIDKRSTLHVQLDQCGLRTPQCTLQGSLDRPEDERLLKKLQSVWMKRFGEEINETFLYVVSVDRVLQQEDFQENGVWVSSSDYRSACPDPLREIAEKVVTEINENSMEDVLRFCNVYADLQFQVSEAKMIWVDRLGFDMRVYSPPNGIYEVRIPFPREVTDEKGVKSTFNGMSQVAWEVEKSYYPANFERVTQAKKLALARL